MRNSRHLIRIAALAVLTASAAGTDAGAAVVDLTTGSGSSGTIGGAKFVWGVDPGGTGVIKPFVRVQASGTEEGYNTSVSKQSDLPFNETFGTWTHDLRLNEVPLVESNGVQYFEFVLDVNESSGGGQQYISLDKVQVFTSATGGKNTKAIAQLGTLQYTFGSGDGVWLDYSLNSGSGTVDMTMLLPVSLFDDAAATDYVYFYSKFGEQGNQGGKKLDTSDGFEEWSVQIFPDSQFIPEPATLTLVGIGGLLALGRRRR